MKKLIFIFVTLLYSSSLFSQGIKFQDLTIQQAMDKVSKDKKVEKYIFVDCYTTWCIPCAQMSSEVFTQKVCGDYINANYLPIKLNVDKEDGKMYMKKYNLQAFPTFLILDGQGNEINRLIGFMDAPEFVKKMQESVKPENRLDGLKAAFEKNHDYTSGLAYAKKLQERSEDATEVLNYVYDHSMDYERFGGDLMQVIMNGITVKDAFFRKIMLDKAKIDEYTGKQRIDRMIFDKVRKDLYTVALGDTVRYNVHYTKEEVERAVYTVSLLCMTKTIDLHICRVALFCVNHDMDGLIDYYKRYIWVETPSAYKGILDNILLSKYDEANESQKALIKAYYSSAAKNLEYDAKRYENLVKNVENK